jgi:outer membrane receptor protein involved in Fe transport
LLNFDRAGWLRGVFLEVVYVDNEVTNLILFFPNSQHTTKPTNVGSATVKGWEVSFAASIGARFRLSGNYTRLDTEDTSDIPYYRGNRLPSRPRDDALLVAAYRADRWRLTWEAHFIGANFLDRANMGEVPARGLHGVIFRALTPLPGVTISLEALNLTDDRATDVSGFPLPGRALYATMSYKM